MTRPAIRPNVNPAEQLARAIREHRDEKWQGDVVQDAHDLSLYTALVWYETEYPEEAP